MNDQNYCFILVIDDEISILKMLKLQLSRKGFIVETANSGKKAIQKIDRYQYDLILTDIKMPDISGDRILHYIKSEKDNNIPVIGMSGTPWYFEQSDFDAVLNKPFFVKEILKLIAQFYPDKGMS